MGCNLLELNPYLLLSWELGYSDEGKSLFASPWRVSQGQEQTSIGGILGLHNDGSNCVAKSLILVFVLGSSTSCKYKPHSELVLSAEKK